MKFLHCSDIHLGRKPVGSAFSEYANRRYEDYFKAFNYIVRFAVENNVDAFLISGDLFDRRELSPDVLERAERDLELLRKKNIPVVAIEGNHDRIFAIEGRSWLEYLSREKLLYLLRPKVSEVGEISFPRWDGSKGATIEIKGVKFYGVGYQGFSFPQYFQALGKVLDASKVNVILAHTSIEKTDIVPGCVKAEDLEPLMKKCDYIAGGHIHTKRVQQERNFFVPGAPEYWDVKEKNEKGFFVYDTETKEFEFHRSLKRKKISAAISLETGQSTEFSNRFSEALKSNPVEKGCLYVLEIRIPFGTFFETNLSQVESDIEEKGALKAYAFTTIGKGTVEESETTPEIDILEEDVISKNATFANYSKKIAKALENLKRFHREKNDLESSDALDKLFDEILEGEDNAD